MFIVELEPGVWLADGLGDPCRTLRSNHARLFGQADIAEQALTRARRFRPFALAKVVPV